jgi:hypothetical protein
MGVSTALPLLAQQNLGGPSPPGFTRELPRQIEAHLTSYLFVFAVHVLIYRLVPYRRLEWRLVASGAALAAFLFELGKNAFVFYLNRVAHLSRNPRGKPSTTARLPSTGIRRLTSSSRSTPSGLLAKAGTRSGCSRLDCR